MAKKDWPLLEKLQDGPIKENLIELQGDLEKILEAKNILLTLNRYERETDHDTLTLSVETVFSLVCVISANVDSVFYHLNHIFESEAQAAAEGGA